MAPKRKGRKAAHDDAAPTPAQSMENLGILNKKVAGLVQDVYDRRFAKPGESGTDLPWPLCHGGTFIEVAQRAWEKNGEQLLASSLKMLQNLGMQDASLLVEDFRDSLLIQD